MDDAINQHRHNLIDHLLNGGRVQLEGPHEGRMITRNRNGLDLNHIIDHPEKYELVDGVCQEAPDPLDFKYLNGQTGTDTVTGFTGLITGRADYITGCNQYLLQPRVKGENKEYVSPKWFDEDRVMLVDTAPLEIHNSKNGADIPAPTK